MSGAKKTVNRQSFGPNETDINLCYFVCWDTTPDLDDEAADRWAHFTHDEDAVEFFKLKSKDDTLYVWKGELGISKADKQFDWFQTHWSKNLNSHHVDASTPGKGYRWSNGTFEEFDSLEFEEEEN